MYRIKKIGTEGHVELIDGERSIWVEGNMRRPTHEEAEKQMIVLANQDYLVKECVDNIRYLVTTFGLLVDDSSYYLARRYLMYRSW